MLVCHVLVFQVTVPPGPLGVVLDGEIGDRPVVLEVQGVSYAAHDNVRPFIFHLCSVVFFSNCSV